MRAKRGPKFCHRIIQTNKSYSTFQRLTSKQFYVDSLYTVVTYNMHDKNMAVFNIQSKHKYSKGSIFTPFQ